MTSLLDTGSMVTTVTEGFFGKHICPTGDVESTSSWLKLKAANGLDIPYIGYVELDVEVLGKILPKRGILIIKDPHDPSTQARKQDIPGLLGMNVIGACKELLTQDHDVTAVEGWTQVLQEIRTENDRQVRGFVRIAGRSDVRVPAGSASTVKVTGLQHGECNQVMIEPLTTILPGNLLVVNTLS